MSDIENQIAALSGLPTAELRVQWQKFYRAAPLERLSRDLLIRGIAYKMQENAQGGLTQATKRKLRLLAEKLKREHQTFSTDPALNVKPGVKLVREWGNHTHTVLVRENGFDYDGRCYRSLTMIAREITGAHWSGPRFFGLKGAKPSVKHRVASDD
jgi:hypothetical protein